MTGPVTSTGLLASDMGSSESREANHVASSNGGDMAVTAGQDQNGRIVDEEEVIHYAAAAEELLAATALEVKRKKRMKKYNNNNLRNDPAGSKHVEKASVASTVAAVAAALKGEASATRTQTRAVGKAVAPEVSEKKKRKKKNSRQTSQEEESAQALLALNKGGLRSSGGAENEQAVADEEGESPSTTVTPPKKEKRSKLRSEVLFETHRENLVTAPTVTTNHGGDGNTTDALSEPFTSANASLINGSEYTEDPNALQALEIPDQRIITEHLAAHMAKIAHPEPQPEEPPVEQKLITELGNTPQPMIGAAGFISVNRGETSQLSGPSPNGRKKRKRQADNNTAVNGPMNSLVDPQLMQLDHDAALAAVETPGDANAGVKKRRRVPNVSRPPVQEPEIPIDAIRKMNRRKPTTPGEGRTNWGTAPAASTGEAVNGGTFSLEERHTIDNALVDYCKIHDMTMDELKDRVWGNNRRKDEFWDTICLSVPTRSRASVYKHVRRSCHIFQQRAKWTPEEDDELAELVKEKGNRWKDIGEAMGRMGEDCRDRYRNYVKCGKSRGTDRWSEEEEELLKKVVREHKEQTKQYFIQHSKPLPLPEEEDAILINWTTVSEMMENKRSRIQCRYKWKKMLVQNQKVKQAPIGVTYVGGKKKRLSFDTSSMLPGDRQWLLYLIRDSGATQENEIPWDLFAKNDKEIGIWTHKDLKNAYKGFRSHIPHKRRPLVEIIKQLINELEQFTPESRKQRFIPSAEDEATAATATQQPSANRASTPGQSDHRSPNDFETQLYQIVDSTPIAPVASMGPAQQATQSAPEVMVDPDLIGQGMDELQKMAGEALDAHSHGLHAAMQQEEGEDENERELRKRLGGYIQSDVAMETSGPA